jgi:hypothetical protein
VSYFSGIDPMEKKKKQRDAESGGGILTYMQQVGKTNFTKGPFLKVTRVPKIFPNQK